jgi:hypothetical protein
MSESNFFAWETPTLIPILKEAKAEYGGKPRFSRRRILGSVNPRAAQNWFITCSR